MKQYCLILFFLTFMLSISTAQTSQNTNSLDNDITYDMTIFDHFRSESSFGKVIMPQDSALEVLIGLQVARNKSNNGIDGFRVRLYRSNKADARREATEIKAMFLEFHDDISVYQEFQPPYWKVNVGDFRTYGEALKLQTLLEREMSEIKNDIFTVPAKVQVY